MNVTLPNLPYAMNALAPAISEETIAVHYGKHHATYVKNTQNLIAGTALADKPLKEIILTAAANSVYTDLFHNAAQCFNHDFYWQSLTPMPQEMPEKLHRAIVQSFGSVAAFREVWHKAALGVFGSGWVWLVQEDQTLKIVQTSNADTPLVHGGQVPLLCVDVWEHAYYLDYQNRRADYATALWDKMNWVFAAGNMV